MRSPHARRFAESPAKHAELSGWRQAGYTYTFVISPSAHLIASSAAIPAAAFEYMLVMMYFESTSALFGQRGPGDAERRRRVQAARTAQEPAFGGLYVS